MRSSPPLPVDAADVLVLRGWVEHGGGSAARRAQIVLLSGQGIGPSAIAAQLRCSTRTVITWRERYRARGLAGLRDAPRSGRPVSVDGAAVVRRTLERPADGSARWTTRTLGAELGISNVSVGGVWRAWGITPVAAGRVRLLTDPPLDAPVAAVAGVHLGRSVRMLALRTGAPAAGDGRDVGPRLDPDGLLSPRHSGADPEPFLDRLGPVALLVETAAGTGRVRRWAHRRPHVVLHAVAPERDWARPARVACLLAGSSAAGAASVADLCRVLRTDDTVYWLDR